MTQIIPFKLVSLENLSFGKFYTTGSNTITQSISYKKSKSLYIRGPQLRLGSNIIKSEGFFYIGLNFNQDSSLLKTIKNIDNLAILEISHNTQLWYDTNDNIPLTRIENEFIPTIKNSSIHDDLYSISLKIPQDRIEFYDQDNVELPYQLIKEKYPVVPLLHLNAIYKMDNHIWCDWQLPQLKVIVPDNIIPNCQLTDINESDTEDDTIPETELLN